MSSSELIWRPARHRAFVVPGATKALVRVFACQLELPKANRARGLRAIRLRPVQRESLTPITGLGHELFEERLCHLTITWTRHDG
jgi:hypothetical protein